jgi:hypothetical protein
LLVELFSTFTVPSYPFDVAFAAVGVALVALRRSLARWTVRSWREDLGIRAGRKATVAMTYFWAVFGTLWLALFVAGAIYRVITS